jgi:hypothetical protein
MQADSNSTNRGKSGSSFGFLCEDREKLCRPTPKTLKILHAYMQGDYLLCCRIPQRRNSETVNSSGSTHGRNDPLAIQLTPIRDRAFFSRLLWSCRGRIGPNRDRLSFCAILAEAMVRIEMWRVPSLDGSAFDWARRCWSIIKNRGIQV